MKKTLFALSSILLFGSLTPPNDKGVSVNSKDVKLPGWQWSSGNLSFASTAVKPCFAIVFSPSVYHPGDSVKITFASFKVMLSNLNKGTTFEKWTGKIRLVYYKDKKWVSLVKDTSRLINHPFSGKKNNAIDSLTTCSVMLVVPSNMSYTIAADMRGIEMNGADGHGQPINATGGQMLAVSIKGIEVEKVGKN
jgi:hypothetical protein